MKWWRDWKDRRYAAGDEQLCRGYPELLQLDTPRERAECWRQCSLRSLRKRLWRVLFWALVISVAAQVALRSMIWPFQRWISQYLSSSTLSSIISGVAGGLLAVIGFALFKRGVHQELRQELHQRGHHICLQCGYDLRAQPGARCPECGTDPAPAAAPQPDSGAAQQRTR